VSLITIAEKVAKENGFVVPANVVGSTSRELVELLSFANEVGRDLARRADWTALRASVTLTGDGTAKDHALGANFKRLAKGYGVTVGGAPVRTITQGEFAALAATEGTPRYAALDGLTLALWPYLADAATARANIITGAWCSNGSDAFAADSDTSLIDEDVFAKGLIAHWRRQKGMPYADHEAEFEASLAAAALFDHGARL